MAFKRSTLRYGETPEPVTPYQKAAQVWDERIGSARVQAHNWRLMALGSLALSLVLAATLLWAGRSGSTVPYVVEVDPRGGARAVGTAAETYKPSDAQIAFHLARFVDHVRSLSIDPVVVRQNWLKAYDIVTDRAAVSLNEYARESDPFQRIGRETVAVEVASVVRASDSSFQVRWLERQFDGGALKDTRRLTGLISILIKPPRTVEQVRKNPLGIYVHAFNWSQDVAASGEAKWPLVVAIGRLRWALCLPSPLPPAPPASRCRKSRSSTARPSRPPAANPIPSPRSPTSRSPSLCRFLASSNPSPVRQSPPTVHRKIASPRPSALLASNPAKTATSMPSRSIPTPAARSIKSMPPSIRSATSAWRLAKS